MRPNTIKQLWADDQPALGAWLGSASTIVAEQMAHAGFDWLCVDGEHSPVDILTMVQMMQVISSTDTIPIARVQWNDPVQVKRVLDGGAYGVVIPWVNTAAEAEQAVAACRYPPRGIRGFGPYRGGMYGGPDYGAHADEEIACIIQIETIGAVERIDEILSVPGVDATLIGPADLAMSLGVPVIGDNPHPGSRSRVRRSARGVAAQRRRAGHLLLRRGRSRPPRDRGLEVPQHRHRRAVHRAGGAARAQDGAGRGGLRGPAGVARPAPRADWSRP